MYSCLSGHIHINIEYTKLKLSMECSKGYRQQCVVSYIVKPYTIFQSKMLVVHLKNVSKVQPKCSQDYKKASKRDPQIVKVRRN